MEKIKNALAWCALAAFLGFAASSFGWVEFPRWAGYLAGVTIVAFMAWSTIDTEKAQSRRLAAGDDAVQKLTAAEQEIATLKRERDWVVSYGTMYGGGWLLNIPSGSVLPTLDRIGERLSTGRHWTSHPVIVQKVGNRTLVYADAARIEDPYSVLEGEIVYRVLPQCCVVYASVELISHWFSNGCLSDLTPEQQELARQVSQQYGAVLRTASTLRDSIDAAAIDVHAAAVPIT